MSNKNNKNIRQFSYTEPISYQGASYPSTIMDIEDNNGNISSMNVFVDNNGQYYTLSNGQAQPISLLHNLDEVTVTPNSRENLLSKEFNDYITASNDNTQVLNVPHQRYNSNQDIESSKGARTNAAWVREHPNAAAWSNVTSAVPFAVAAYPFVAGAADIAAGTALGQGITNGLNFVANAASNSTWLPWVNAAATSYFGTQGVQDIQNGKFTPETALDLAPLTQVAKPMYEAGKGSL